jgi:hypothetical protein
MVDILRLGPSFIDAFAAACLFRRVGPNRGRMLLVTCLFRHRRAWI